MKTPHFTAFVMEYYFWWKTYLIYQMIDIGKCTLETDPDIS